MAARAQEPYADTAISDTSFYAESDTSTAIEGEYIPERPVIYNSAAPTATGWQHATSDKAYGYRDKQEWEGKEEKPPKDPWIFKVLAAIFGFFGSPVGQALLWGALIAIVGYVLYKLLGGEGGIFSKRDRKADESGEGQLSEESLLEMDWEKALREALQSGDARAAIRFSYLRLLQLLQQRELIAYRPDKTNMDYYRELAEKPQRQAFRTVSRQYEWAWYGNVVPEKAGMDSYLQTFNALKQSIESA